MEVEPRAQPRKTVLKDAVTEALHNAFNDTKARELLVAETTRCFATSDRSEVDNLLAAICKVVQKTVQAHVDNWTAERGLEQALDIVDEQCIRAASPFSAHEATAPLTRPSAALPNTSYAQVRLNCKKKQLEELKQDLANRNSQVEQLKTEVTQQIEAASALSRNVGNIEGDVSMARYATTNPGDNH